MIECRKCHKEFEDKDSIMVCSRCGAMYHKNCWFSEINCITEDCGNDRGLPLRGENLDPDMTDEYIKELLAKSNTKMYVMKKYLPMIVCIIIFLTWIVLNSYHNYQAEQQKNNTITFTEKE